MGSLEKEKNIPFSKCNVFFFFIRIPKPIAKKIKRKKKRQLCHFILIGTEFPKRDIESINQQSKQEGLIFF